MSLQLLCNKYIFEFNGEEKSLDITKKPKDFFTNYILMFNVQINKY